MPTVRYWKKAIFSLASLGSSRTTGLSGTRCARSGSAGEGSQLRRYPPQNHRRCSYAGGCAVYWHFHLARAFARAAGCHCHGNRDVALCLVRISRVASRIRGLPAYFGFQPWREHRSSHRWPFLAASTRDRSADRQPSPASGRPKSYTNSRATLIVSEDASSSRPVFSEGREQFVLELRTRSPCSCERLFARGRERRPLCTMARR